MKQLKALLKKEWQTNRNTFLTPFWFTLGVCAVGLLGYIINLIKGNPIAKELCTTSYTADMNGLILYSSVAAAVAAIGTAAIISAIILADTLLNGGFKRKCEILHLSQPVSIYKIIGTKYLFMSLGTIMLFAGITLISSIAIHLVMNYYIGVHFYYGITAWAQTLIQFSLSLLFISSLYWFFAGLFRRKSFFMGTLLILGIQASISVLNYTADLQIPSLLGYILRLASTQSNFEMISQSMGQNNFSSIIERNWSLLLDQNALMKLLYSIVFFFAGGILYSRRELS